MTARRRRSKKAARDTDAVPLVEKEREPAPEAERRAASDLLLRPPGRAAADFGELSRAEPDEHARRSGGREKTEPRPAAGVLPRWREREREHEFLRLTELVREDLVKLPLEAGDQWGAVDELLRLLVARGELAAGLTAEAEVALREREAIRPTGWKYGLAFPNGRLSGLKRIVAAVGISPGGVDFSCRDGLPARIIVLLLFPQGCYARFAPAIQDIAESFEEAPLREALLGAREPAEVIEAIEEAESQETA